MSFESITREILGERPLQHRENRGHAQLPTQSWARLAKGLGAVILILLLAGCGRGTSVISPTVEEPETESPAAAFPVVMQTPPSPESLPTATVITPPAPLAALVNGEYLFLATYEAAVVDYEQVLLEQGLDLSSENGQTALAQMRGDVLEDMIDFVLIAQGGAALGVRIGAEDVENQVQADIAEGGGEELFTEWLAATDQTREDYVTMVGDALLAQRVFDVVTADVPDSAEQVHAWQICVGSTGEIEQILAPLEQGSTFEEVALEQALDPATEDSSGDLGWFPRGVIAPELEQEAFSLQVGETSDLVQLDDGYCLLKVVERDADHPMAADLLLELKLTAFDRWLDELRAASDIVRYVTE